MVDCKTKFTTKNFIEDIRIKEANTAMFGRLRMLGVFVLLVLIILAFMFACITNIYQAISTYRYLSQEDEKMKGEPFGITAITNGKYDDEVFNDKNGDVLVDEYNEFKRNMAKVKQLYADYNDKIAQYQRSLDQDPSGDLVDEKMMVQEYDDYY